MWLVSSKCTTFYSQVSDLIDVLLPQVSALRNGGLDASFGNI